MKRLTVVLVLLLPALLQAQDTAIIHNFRIVDHEVVYRHTFRSADNIDSKLLLYNQLLTLFLASPNINSIHEFKERYTFTCNVEYQNATEGYPWEMVKGYATIAVIGEEYVVTISNMIDNPNAGTLPFTFLFLKNNPPEWKSGIDQKLARFDDKFTAIFTIK
jgi:hypothetical protein